MNISAKFHWNHSIKWKEISSRGIGVSANGQTDRRTDGRREDITSRHLMLAAGGGRVGWKLSQHIFAMSSTKLCWFMIEISHVLYFRIYLRSTAKYRLTEPNTSSYGSVFLPSSTVTAPTLSHIIHQRYSRLRYITFLAVLLVPYCISWQGVTQCGFSNSPDRCCHFALPAAGPGCWRLLINRPVWGRGTPLPPCPFTSSSFPPFYFSLSFIGFTYFLLLSIPSLSTRIVPLRFQTGGRRRRPNLGLVCVFVCVLLVLSVFLS